MILKNYGEKSMGQRVLNEFNTEPEQVESIPILLTFGGHWNLLTQQPTSQSHAQDGLLILSPNSVPLEMLEEHTAAGDQHESITKRFI